MKKALKASVIMIIALITGTFILSNVASASSSTAAARKSGISGIILIGPVKPVSKIGQSNTAPYKATVIVKAKKSSRVIAKFTSDKNGRFLVVLNPGEYILEPAPGGALYPKAASQNIKVVKGKFTFITINYDSGMR